MFDHLLERLIKFLDGKGDHMTAALDRLTAAVNANAGAVNSNTSAINRAVDKITHLPPPGTPDAALDALSDQLEPLAAKVIGDDARLDAATPGGV